MTGFEPKAWPTGVSPILVQTRLQGSIPRFSSGGDPASREFSRCSGLKRFEMAGWTIRGIPVGVKTHEGSVQG
jgi:hypothetical protein